MFDFTLLQPPGGVREKRRAVLDLEGRTIETMRAEHRVLSLNGHIFIGWHVTTEETARTLVRGGRYVPPERIGSVSVRNRVSIPLLIVTGLPPY